MAAEQLEVLEANDALYRAFRERDVEAMERLWAERLPVTCVHPGWDVLDARADVIASWRRILESEGAPDITCSHAEARVVGAVAWVTCHERLDDAVLAAVNVFAQEDGAWRLVHHQATPVAPGQVRARRERGPAN